MSGLSKLLQSLTLTVKVQLGLWQESFRSLLGKPFIEDSKKERKEESTADYIFPSHKPLMTRLKSQDYTVVNVYSPNNALLSATIYGKDIVEYASFLRALYQQLMLDELIVHDKVMEKRQTNFVRTFFYVGREFLNSESLVNKLIAPSLQLIEGYELRRHQLDIGTNTYQNLVTTQIVLGDLHAFFQEVLRDRDHHLPRSRTHPNRVSG